MKLLPVFGRHVEFRVKESPVKVGMYEWQVYVYVCFKGNC